MTTVSTYAADRARQRPLRCDLYVAMDKAHRGDTACSEVLDGFEVAVDDVFAW